MNENLFFEKLGLTPGDWYMTDGCVLGKERVVCELRNSYNDDCIPDGEFIAASKNMFMGLFYRLIKAEWKEHEEKEDCACEECEQMREDRETMESATGKTWEEIKNIAIECGV